MFLKFLKRVYFYIRIFWNGLFIGMKNTNKLLISSQKDIDGALEITKNDSGGVYKDLLEQKITQEVEELRYTSYIVANESKKYKYIGNGTVVKKNNLELNEKHGIIEESDNLPIILIQDISLVCESVNNILKEVNLKENKKINSEYNIKINRKNLPRFKIEEYIKKLVLKESDENYVLDLYCSKYPRQFSERKDKPFLSEIKKIKNKEIKPNDILDFEEISFITNNAWGVDDYHSFSFNSFEFYDIIDFDGNYIIRLGCESNVFMKNLLDEIYSKSADEKYKNKEAKKGFILDITTYNNKEDFQKDNELKTLEKTTFSLENNNKK